MPDQSVHSLRPDRAGAKGKRRGRGARTARSLLKDFPNFAPASIISASASCPGPTCAREDNLAGRACAYGDEIRVRERLVLSQPRQQTFQTELADAYRNLAVVAERYDHLDKGRTLLDKSLAIDRRLARESRRRIPAEHVGPDADAVGRSGVARRSVRRGAKTIAKRSIRGVLVEQHPDVLEYREALAMTADNLGVFCSERGELDAAQTYYERALLSPNG